MFLDVSAGSEAPTMDERIKKFLEDRGFSHYVEKFANEDIDFDTLIILDRHAIGKLTNKVGEESRLWNAVEILKKAQQTTSSSVDVASTSHELAGNNIGEKEHESISSMSMSLLDEDTPVEIEGQLSSNESEPLAVSPTVVEITPTVINFIPTTITPEKYSETLKAALLDCPDGQEILQYHNLRNGLTDSLRNKLTDIVLRLELKPENKYTCPPYMWTIISKAIRILFPSEREAIYYIPYANLGNNQHISAQGKLVDKYNNRRTALRAVKLISPKKKKKKLDPLFGLFENSTNPNEKKDIDWLQLNITERWDLIVKVWSRTGPGRAKILRECPDSQTYIDKFALIKTPKKGHDLILLDFDTLYPDKKDNFITEWPALADTIFEKACERQKDDVSFKTNVKKGNISLDRNQGPTEKQVTALKLLPYLLLPPALASKTWKPTRADAAESIILELKSYGDLENKREARKAKLAALKIRSQLMTVLVKSEETTTTYVNIDLTDFKFDSIIEGFDFMFKSYFVFNLQFPPESYASYSFLQKYVYDIPLRLEKRKVLSTIEALATDLKIGEE